MRPNESRSRARAQTRTIRSLLRHGPPPQPWPQSRLPMPSKSRAFARRTRNHARRIDIPTRDRARSWLPSSRCGGIHRPKRRRVSRLRRVESVFGTAERPRNIPAQSPLYGRIPDALRARSAPRSPRRYPKQRCGKHIRYGTSRGVGALPRCHVRPSTLRGRAAARPHPKPSENAFSDA